MSHNQLPDVMALLIPILFVTVSLAALIIWIVVGYRRRVHEIDCRHKERMAAIEKGLELPPESLPQPEQMPPRSRYLLRGLVWLGVGLAITFGGRNWLQAPMGGSGWIAVAVGVAYLIFYFVEGHRTAVPKPEAAVSSGDQTL
jgi:uncharacterized membrane protein YhaH (DUF805 family)